MTATPIYDAMVMRSAVTFCSERPGVWVAGVVVVPGVLVAS
jgi:hypothetical protein